MTPASAGRTALRVGAVVLLSILLLSPVTAAAAGTGAAAPPRAEAVASAIWAWPTASHQVVVAYGAPENRYTAGHRGIDLSAPVGSAVTAPADGVVAFAGQVAGRPVLTIDHGAGLVSTLEPVTTDAHAGDEVHAGADVGEVAMGGHARRDTVHLGARRGGDYINPLLLLGGIPRAVLLPCCG